MPASGMTLFSLAGGLEAALLGVAGLEAMSGLGGTCLPDLDPCGAHMHDSLAVLRLIY